MSRRMTLSLVIAITLGLVGACDQKSPIAPTPPVPCAFTLSPPALTFDASAANASVIVTTTAACAWTAASDRGWMTIGSGATGTGSGRVDVSVTANVNPDTRTGTLTIAGQAVAVTQSGATPCTVSLAPASAAFGTDAATGGFTVTAPAACAWTATTTDNWITIASGAAGTGTAPVGYAITRNTSVAARTGTIRVGAATFSIAQQGDTPAPSCDFHVSPVVLNACMSVPHELLVSIATGPSCGWTAASDTPWIAVSGGSSRSGPGELRFRIGDNYDAPRLGVVKVRWDTPTAGQNVQVSQAGCRYALSATGRSVPADGGAFSFDVYQQSDPLECGGPLQNGCVWSATADVAWITLTSPMPKAGDDRVTFAVASNGGPARMGRITVRDKVFVVTQDAR